jgi:hypothetical protein
MERIVPVPIRSYYGTSYDNLISKAKTGEMCGFGPFVLKSRFLDL